MLKLLVPLEVSVVRLPRAVEISTPVRRVDVEMGTEKVALSPHQGPSLAVVLIGWLRVALGCRLVLCQISSIETDVDKLVLFIKIMTLLLDAPQFTDAYSAKYAELAKEVRELPAYLKATQCYSCRLLLSVL
jgi:hypothetical protein